MSDQPTSGTTPVLEFRNVDTHYGSVQILHDVSIAIAPGELICLLGGNASGKTTTLRTILGMVEPSAGSVLIDGQPVNGLSTAERVALGVSMVPENRRLFKRMSVRENLEIGAYLRKDDEQQADLERIFEMFPRVKERLNQTSGTLSGGEQQMVAVGRALMSRPKVLLMDEPSMGLAPKLIAQIFSIITEINQQGTTVLLVEQNAAQALKRAHRAYVLETGNVVKTGAGIELLDDPAVRAAYLGGH
jgi:branched-chain amino acid transport system ATP-binding protein